MRNPQGYITVTEPGMGTVERDSFTCSHCNKLVMVEPMCDPADMGGLCYGCHKLVCPQCVEDGKCDPIEEKLLRAEASYHARRSYG